jgi:hypothetical protein
LYTGIMTDSLRGRRGGTLKGPPGLLGELEGAPG